MPTPASEAKRYHHGNLKTALLGAAVDRARAEGRAGIVVREIARDVGVTSAAMYRHYPDADHLLAEVARYARQELATAMIDARDAVPRRRSTSKRAVERFLTIGRAYVRFAVSEPGLFEVAFAACSAQPEEPDDPSSWEVLEAGLDELVTAGALDPAMRAGAPMVAWSAVHGLAFIMWQNALPPGIDPAIAEDDVMQGIVHALDLEPGSHHSAGRAG